MQRNFFYYLGLILILVGLIEICRPLLYLLGWRMGGHTAKITDEYLTNQSLANILDWRSLYFEGGLFLVIGILLVGFHQVLVKLDK